MSVTETAWHPFCADAELPVDGKIAQEVEGWSVLVIRSAEGLRAMIDRCTHQAALLSTGRVRRGAIMCPLHGARFEVDTGRCIGGAYASLRLFETRVVDGMIEVAVPVSPPGPSERPVRS